MNNPNASPGETPKIGFIGLGLMGEAMALNLVKTSDIVIWNRSPEKAAAVVAAGGVLAIDLAALFRLADVVILMLADEVAIDTVLERGNMGFATRVAGHVLVQMGTVAPAYSRGLEADVLAAGGRYVEAPVSGSRKPAEDGTLVAMLAGEARAVAYVAPLLAPMCHEVVSCGAVPNALVTKLAVNLYLIAMVTGLAEATHFARMHGLEMDRFLAVLEAGPMASSVSRIKAAKLAICDFAPQATISDVRKNSSLISQAAREAHIASPILDTCDRLFADAVDAQMGQLDMVAVVQAIEARTLARRNGETLER